MSHSGAKDLPTVLVVDDDILMRLANAKLLENMAQVVMAENTYEAEELMRAHHPALVLLDDIMPNCPSGLSLLEKVKKDEDLSDIPIIMVTASNKEAEVSRGMAAGAAAYITKPVNVEELRRDVMRVLSFRPMKVVVLISDDDLADELQERFVRLKCDLDLVDQHDAVAMEPVPDLLILETISATKVLRAREGWGKVPAVVLGTGQDDGASVPDPVTFVAQPFSSQDIVREAGRLLRPEA